MAQNLAGLAAQLPGPGTPCQGLATGTPQPPALSQSLPAGALGAHLAMRQRWGTLDSIFRFLPFAVLAPLSLLCHFAGVSPLFN